jgi:hypothetical protein
LVGKIVIVSLKKGVEKGVCVAGYPDKSFPMRRVLKVDENKELMTRQLQIVSHGKGVEKTEARGGLHTRPKPVSHERGVESFYAEKFLISRWKRVMDCCGEM